MMSSLCLDKVIACRVPCGLDNFVDLYSDSPSVTTCMFIHTIWFDDLTFHQTEDKTINDIYIYIWWHHQMETFSASLTLCVGNSPLTGDSPHKGQWRGAFMFSLIWAWVYNWVNNRKAGDWMTSLLCILRSLYQCSTNHVQWFLRYTFAVSIVAHSFVFGICHIIWEMLNTIYSHYI